MKRLLFSLLIVFECCQPDKLYRQNDELFKIPTVNIQPFVKAKILKVDSMPISENSFGGKYKFTNAISKYNSTYDTFYTKDVMWNYTRIKCDDTFNTDGFELFADYNQSIPEPTPPGVDTSYVPSICYPVFIVNETPRTNVFFGKDRSSFAIQEALDSNGYWFPMDVRPNYTCGNGFFGLKVHPKEFIMLLFPKYAGTYKTSIRVKIKIGSNIYITKPFYGMVNRKQFRLTNYAMERLKNEKRSWMFFNLDWEVMNKN